MHGGIAFQGRKGRPWHHAPHHQRHWTSAAFQEPLKKQKMARHRIFTPILQPRAALLETSIRVGFAPKNQWLRIPLSPPATPCVPCPFVAFMPKIEIKR
jgi:hypothetical protein